MSAIAAWILCGVVMLFVGARWLLNDLRRGMLPLLSAMFRPTFGAITMAVSLLSVQSAYAVGQQWLTGIAALFGLVVFGALVYAATVGCLWMAAGRPHEAESELIFLLRSRLNRAS